MSAEVMVMGRLGADPEIKFTAQGKAVASFSLVSSKSSKDGDNWVETETTWYRVSVWDSLAENVAESLTKGDAVLVRGRVYMDTYKDREGNDRQSLKITAQDVGPSLRRATWSKKGVDRGAAAVSVSDDKWTTRAEDDIPPF